MRMTGDFSTSMGRFQPYARVNLWHGFSGTDRTGFLSPAAVTNFENRIGYTSVEVAAGATLALTPTTSIYGEIGSLAKAGGQSKVKSSIQGSLGVKLRF
ncbi:MAG: autotransporter domain-containing protein [Comamonadaceae bacterium]|nr:MAG: autotransporter domain-containing protein [Comamonadaceae bacterium]